MDEQEREVVGGFSRSWARACAIVEGVYNKRPMTSAQVDTLARLFLAERHVRGFDWLPDDRETDALVRQARGEGAG